MWGRDTSGGEDAEPGLGHLGGGGAGVTHGRGPRRGGARTRARSSGCFLLTAAASTALFVATAARRRVAAGQTDFDAPTPGESPVLRTRFYGCLRAFLLLSMLLLAVDVATHVQGWHLAAAVPDLLAVEGLFAACYASWVCFRLEYFVPALQFQANVCVVLFLTQSVDHLILCLSCLWIRLKGIKPMPKTTRGKGSDDVEVGAE